MNLHTRVKALEQSRPVAGWHPTVHLVERDWNESNEDAKRRQLGFIPIHPDICVVVVNREKH